MTWFFAISTTASPGCTVAFNAIPIHLENTKFPAVGPRVLNLSTRGTVSSGDNVLINGFIITGTDPKTVVLRALGPSLSRFGVSGALADPVLSVYNSSGTLIATNDNWQTDIGSDIYGAKRVRARRIQLNQPLCRRTWRPAPTPPW